jgi:hypothetical protein
VVPTSDTSSQIVFNKEKGHSTIIHAENGSEPIISKKKAYIQNLKIFSGTYTNENLWNLFIRPIGLILLPPVLWGSLVMSVTIGFIVAVTSNVAPAYATAYGFSAWQTGLCFFSAIIGSLIGIFVGGHMSDKVADFFTKRNGGIREPEMRLPAIAISLITAPLALLLYGAGIQYRLHWICPTIGLGLCKALLSKNYSCANFAIVNFSIVQATNVSLVYTIDAYRPIAGEIVVTAMAFKCESKSNLTSVATLTVSSTFWLPSFVLYQSLD